MYQEDDKPTIFFKDEIVYGLGNIIQNAIQHSKTKVLVNISWNIPTTCD